jgi:Protein of unknown function (DUF2934)
MSAAPPLSPNSLPERRIASTGQTLAPNSQSNESSRFEDIAQLAYALWQQRGCPAGSAETDWLEAEQQLSRQVNPESRRADHEDLLSGTNRFDHPSLFLGKIVRKTPCRSHEF